MTLVQVMAILLLVIPHLACFVSLLIVFFRLLIIFFRTEGRRAMSNPGIFIRYSHQDKEWCRALATALREQGCDVWHDERLLGGMQWLANIERELQSREFFVLLLSPDAWVSAWVQKEYNLAMACDRVIIPLMHREVQVSGFLRIIQMVTAIGDAPDEAARKVVDVLRQYGAMPAVVEAAEAAPPTPTPRAGHTVVAPPQTIMAQQPVNISRQPPRLFIWSILNDEPPRIVSVTTPEITIGRDPSNDLVLADTSASRLHARLARQPDGWYIEQQAEGGPIYVNGQAMAHMRLAMLDQIILGRTIIRLELPPPENAALLQPVPCFVVDCPECHFIAPLRMPEMVVGRAPDSTIVIPAAVVSHHAARLTQQAGGQYAIEDLGMRNPLHLGDTIISHHVLQEGDRLTIGASSVQSTVLLR